MKTQIKKHPLVFSFLILLYVMAIWMGWTIFGAMGLAYVVLVPLPIILFSVLTQKNKGKPKTSHMASIWSTPIPYLGLLLVGSLLFFLLSKLF